MATAIFIKITRAIKWKARKLSVLFSFTVLSLIAVNAQPIWNSGPTVTPQPLSINLSFNLSKSSYVYYFIIPGNYACQTATVVRDYAQRALPYGAIIANDRITYASGNYSTQIWGEIASLVPNTQYTIEIVAEDQAVPGSFSIVSCTVFKTLACPSIYVATAFNNADRCVNGDGATKLYNLMTYNGYSSTYSNVLKGATWTISWGDGTPDYTYTSTYDNDGPGPEILPGFESIDISHTYTVHDSCYRRAVLTIQNPAGCAAVGVQRERKEVLLAGRDWDADGNGSQLLVNAATGSPDTIKVCEGVEAFITLRDDGVWDCDQTFKTYPPGEMNSSDRNVQFVYGMHPFTQSTAGQNTITGGVTITGTYPGTANAAAGHATPVINIPTATMNPITNPHTVSDVIRIPSTALYKQYIHVYFKNWNKCNPYTGNAWDGTAVWDSIVIYIDRRPLPPTPNNETICVNDPVPPLTVTAPGATAFYWYSDAALTTIAPGSDNSNTYNTGISSATPSRSRVP